VKKLFFIIVLFAVPLQLQAFDFHGIKAGMSKDQVYQALKLLGAPAPSETVSLVQMSAAEGLKGVKWSPRSISFHYDHEDRLYSITLSYPVSLRRSEDPPVTGLRGTAFRSALEKKYGATLEIKEVLRGITALEAKIVDDERLERFLSHLINEAKAAI